MRSLPDQFSAEEKLKWENGLRQLWSQMEKNPQDSQPHREAKKKLFEFSKTLTMKLSATRQQQAQQLQPSAQGQQGEGNVARPPSQGQPPQGQASSSAQPNTGQQKQNIPQKLMDHVNSFPYVTPITMVPGSPEAEQWIHEMKGKYLKALTAMENASLRVLQLKSHYDRMQAEGKVFTPAEEEDYQKKSDQAKKGHSDYKQFVDQFRRQQEGFKIARENANAAQGNSAQPTGLNTGANAAVGASANGQNQPPRPQLNLNQPANPALQNTQQTVMGAIEAARNQQMNSGRPPMQNGQASQGMGQGQNPNMPQMPNIKSEQGVPAPINTAVTQMQRNVGPGMQTASPQSAIPRSAGMPQSATSQAPQIPQALSQSDALHQAARRHSSSTSAPNVMGHSHPHPPIARDPPNITNTNKMPIPKHLPERATAPPQPVAMPPNRPSYSGGANNIGNGVMAAPVLPKAPGYHVEGAGGSVLDKKKLDELVRQVTGGGSGLEGGQGLTPEVEEVCIEFLSSCLFAILL